jgi:Fatty acid hydroxylase superfamily
MHTDDAIRAEMRGRGRRIKRNNLVAASLSGAVLACVSLNFFPHSVIGISAGLAAGLVYANGFEYVLHRLVLHSGRGIFCRQHMVHHTTLQSPDAALYVNFSSNPWGVVALFCANAIPVFLLQWISRGAWGAGVFAGFALYYMAFEEIHWRSHMGGWLPKWLRPAARHHLLHHAHDSSRFNVFFPLFDWLLQPASASLGLHHRKENPRL